MKKIAATAGLAAGFLAVLAPSASAATEYWSYTNHASWGAEALMYPKGSEPKDYDYRVSFYPHGEKLILEDRETDGYHAKALVDVYNKSGKHVDADTFILPSNTTSKTYNLGTPDGTGDIPEGYRVRIQVCIDGRGCSQMISDTA